VRAAQFLANLAPHDNHELSVRTRGDLLRSFTCLLLSVSTNWSKPKMPAQNDWLARLRATAITVFVVLLALVLGAFALTDLPAKFGFASSAQGDEHDDHGHADGHDDHDPHAGHDHGSTMSIELSKSARDNMRLRTAPIVVRTFTQYIEVPGVVTSWPGRTHIAVTSPLTGVLNSILVSRGELVASGAPLFSLRLTHQDLVTTQETFLAKLGELDVEQREIQRLSSITSGAIAGKTLLSREYERDKLMASVSAARQSMLLHGLSEEQIDKIESTRELVREITVYAPTLHADQSLHHDALEHSSTLLADPDTARYASRFQPPADADYHEHIDAEFLVTELHARRGQSVTAGFELAQLSDFSEILIEGHAFQRDSQALQVAADTGAAVQAVFESTSEGPEIVDGLKVVYIGTEIGRTSRALPFYVKLENKVERSEKREGRQYVSWRYKPGQRLTVRLPVSEIENAIVVPKDAVAEEGLERFLFVENGDHFERVAVTVISRDSVSVAIANDGHVWPGQLIAVSGAHQLQMELKNRSGGAIDPHAGHNH
jgi:membrane fusion protein, heavy metal efflux system